VAQFHRNIQYRFMSNSIHAMQLVKRLDVITRIKMDFRLFTYLASIKSKVIKTHT